MDNKEVKILRLQNGEDIICNYLKLENGDIEVSEPMSFMLKQHNLLLNHWLPISIISVNKAVLKESDILCEIFVDDEFKEYFENSAKEIADLFDAKKRLEVVSIEDINNETMQDLLNEFETFKELGLPIQ